MMKSISSFSTKSKTPALQSETDSNTSSADNTLLLKVRTTAQLEHGIFLWRTIQ